MKQMEGGGYPMRHWMILTFKPLSIAQAKEMSSLLRQPEESNRATVL